VWYDNPDEEKAKAAPSASAQTKETGKAATGGFFPGSQDPTKAFDEEVETLPGGEATPD